MNNVDNYQRLYNEKLQEAEWYKQLKVRTTIKTIAIFAIVIVLITSSMTAHALSNPLSKVGTIGNQLLGGQGLVIYTAAGFTGDAVLTVLLYKYLQKSVFRVSDYLNEDRGFLYAIKDQQQNIKGYLYGTIHNMPDHWQGINEQIQGKINESRKVIVECRLDEIPVERRNALQGIDFKVMQHAVHSNKEIAQFETLTQQRQMLTQFTTSVLQASIANCLSCNCSTGGISMVEAKDRLTVTWQTGHEESISNILLTLTNGRGAEELGEGVVRAFEELVHQRNITWMNSIPTQLQEQGGPVFIAVGCLHLFDFQSVRTTGLITLLRNAGWIVERVEN